MDKETLRLEIVKTIANRYPNFSEMLATAREIEKYITEDNAAPEQKSARPARKPQ